MSIQLTPQQLSVFNFILNGYTNKHIGKLMRLSDKTIKTHCTAIYKACAVKSRHELMASYHKGSIFVELKKESA